MFQHLASRAVQPEGWLAARLRRDLDGFVGNLDHLAPDLILDDDIYGADRLTASAKLKDVGALMESDDPNAALQFMWWNSETQSNWREGWLRHVMYVGNEQERRRVREYVDRMIATIQDDGYLGIYAPDLRFPSSGENGELWAQATVGRSLLGYIEATPDRAHAAEVLAKLVAATNVTMRALRDQGRLPFPSGCGGGGAHGLAYTDVLDRLADLTGDETYRQHAEWLYRAFSHSEVSESDAVASNLLDPSHMFQGHGVHTYEHLRSLVVAAEVSGDPVLAQALERYLVKLSSCLTPASGPIGDEWIAEKDADAWDTGYEFCSTVELMDSLLRLMVSTGDLAYADAIEAMLFNAGFGAWHPDISAVAYLQTDNAISMAGQRFGLEPDPVQTRYRYSPVHRQAAVCCVPNAGKLLPTYLRGALLRDSDDVAIAHFGPMRAKINVRGVDVELRVVTRFPDELDLQVEVIAQEPVEFALIVRKPGWAIDVTTMASADCMITERADRLVLHRIWSEQTVGIAFAATPRFAADACGDAYVKYGPRLYALSVPSVQTITHRYGVAGLVELTEEPIGDEYMQFALATDRADLLRAVPGGVEAPFRRLDVSESLPSSDIEVHLLQPMGTAPLRRLTFLIATSH